MKDPKVGQEWEAALRLADKLDEELKKVITRDEFNPLLVLGGDWVDAFKAGKATALDLLVVLSVRIANLRMPKV